MVYQFFLCFLANPFLLKKLQQIHKDFYSLLVTTVHYTVWKQDNVYFPYMYGESHMCSYICMGNS